MKERREGGEKERKRKLRNGGSNLVYPAVDRQLLLSCTELQCYRTPSPLKSPLFMYRKQWYYSCMTFARKWLAGELYTKVAMWWHYPESQETSPVEPGQKCHWIRGGLSLSQKVDKRILLTVVSTHFLVCHHSSLFSLIETKKGSIFLPAIDVNPQPSLSTFHLRGIH